ncbi:copper resistance protein CopC [Kitasatospora paracochleata]|uniref:Copper transport protein n=1 Tax=Kitasatospora paracochleata TaxID=58354 RepID=A0ABT1J780_9ACTN|nr:FixH family protein [Kitasatospora paracochleata]MCP2313298.1 copper transport protein [Kitasatospora paracochleata]
MTATRTARRLGALLAVLGAALALVLGGASTASAHATLVRTDPAQNSVVPNAPDAVTLTFSEDVSLPGDSVRVLDPAGKPVDNGNSTHVDGKADTARVTLRSGLANGTYTVAWRVVSEDSHPIGGAFTFSIGAPSDTSVSASAVQTAKADGVVSFVYGTGRAVAYGAFALLAGAAAFVLIVWPRGIAVHAVQRLLMTGWIALLTSTVAVLLLRGPYERGTGIAQALDLSLVRGTLDERIGTALAARLLLLAASGVFLSLLVGQLGQSAAVQPAASAGGGGSATGDEDAEEAELRQLEQRAAQRPGWDARLGLGVVGLALAVALTATWVGADHSAVGIQVWLALPLASVHLLAMALWLGGLATLLVGLRHGLPVAGVERFSKLALAAVTALTVTGVYQSWRGLGSWSALVDTEYGRLLLIKVGCVAAMVGVAWISRSWIARVWVADATGAVAAEAGAAEAVADDESKAVAVGAPAGASASAASGGGDAVREAQLARQRAVREAAGARLAQDGTPARAGLRRSVLVESAVAVAVLVVTTMLTNSPPGRVAEAVAAAPAAQAQTPAPGVSTVPGRTVELKIPYNTGGSTANAKGTATVTVNPAGVGPNAVGLTLDDASGRPIDVPELQLAFTLPDRDLGPLPVALKAEGTGRWSGVAQLPLAGNWVVSVTVRSSDIDQVTAVQQLKLDK